jgi:DNA-binding transcriptional MerR regulator
MSDPTKAPTPQLVPHRTMAERYNVSTKTIDRWSEDGILPEPIRIKTRKYWPTDVAPRHDP